MNFRKLSLFIIIFSLLSLYSCNDDDVNLTGRWQLNRIETADGKQLNVDTVFYSFDRKVFQYLKLTTETTTFVAFGNYRITGNEINIDVVRDTFEPYECDTCLNWSNLSRTFIIRKNSSSALELESEGEILYFRKY